MASVFVSSRLGYFFFLIFFFFSPFLSKGAAQMGKEQVMQILLGQLYLPSPWQRRAGRAGGQRGCGQRGAGSGARAAGRALPALPRWERAADERRTGPPEPPPFVQQDSPPHLPEPFDEGRRLRRPGQRWGSSSPGANCSSEAVPGRASSQVPWLPGTEGTNAQQQLRTKSSR